MKRRNVNGFEDWGGYMNAKISKLEAQFNEEKSVNSGQSDKLSEIFKGISIFVNGYTEPSADELRCLMLAHGGTYHHYFRTEKTTHIIASSLPNAKYNQMKTHKIVTPNWVTDSIAAGKLLNYTNYLLQNNFPQVDNSNTKYDWSFKSHKNKDTIITGLKVSKTAADEDYLKEFYNNSRLHYISTLRSMLKQYVRELREKQTSGFPKRKSLLKNNLDFNFSPDENYKSENVIMHIDMDCFFVAVALRNYPQLKGQPVAVTHAKSNSGSKQENTDRNFELNFYKNKMKKKIKPTTEFQGDNKSDGEDEKIKVWSTEVSSMSEIASCSYEARKLGVSNGMYLGAALKLCPTLKTVPYDFEGYKEVSMTLYNTVAEYTLDIEAVSCDELFVDCTNLLSEIQINPCKLAEVFRSEIEKKTNCTASIGIGANKLQARLATKQAKPNGTFYLSPDKLNDFLKDLSVYDIPGVGRIIGAQLQNHFIKTCGDLQNVSLAFLKKEFGEKTGEYLYNNCRGIDNKGINFTHERKSVSAEINYGIRFNDNDETEKFLKQLCQEVSNRLKDIKMAGKNITLKVMFRAKDAPAETAKYLGHGACDALSRSASLPSSTNDAAIIAKQVINLYHQLNIPPNDLRGIGIQVTKLEPGKKASKTLQGYFNKNCQTDGVSSNNQIKTKQTNESISDSTTENISRTDIKDDKKKSIASENIELTITEQTEQLFRLSFKELKDLIKQWVTAEQSPQIFDVILLKNYFNRLIEKKNLEQLCILIRCLHRCIKTERKEEILWKNIYDDIFDTVQASMVTMFGRTLADEVI